MASQSGILIAHSTVAARTRLAMGYALMIAAMVASYLLIRSYGETLIVPAVGVAVKAHPAARQAGAIGHVLLALLIIIILARVLGSVFHYFHQPPVIGEIIAGILLGPSFLGRVAPEVSAYVLPTSVAPFLGVISEVGVILYMFLVGLELDPGLLKRRGHAAVAISHASIIAPFLLGALASLILYPRLSSSDVRFTSFSLFLGVSMSVTAFPVLARILTDRGMHKSRMGAIALTCAAVDDVTAWCMLALVIAIIQARTAGALVTFGFAMAFIAAMIFIVRPVMVRLTLAYGNTGRLSQGLMAVVFVALLLSAWATDLIGIHAVFGAFALGAVIPHDSGMARELTDRLEDLLIVLLLPAFFAYTGLRTQIGLVSGLEQWTLCGLIIIVASVGKFGGSAIAARITGLNWRDASALGVLMNTRGLVELIVLNIGLDFRVISPTLFAMLVLMALATTLMTTPILDLIAHEMTEDHRDEQKASAPGTARDKVSALRITERLPMLIAVSNPRGMSSLLDIAIHAAQPESPPPRVLTLVRRPSGGIRSGLREVEDRIVPRAPILLSAIDHAKRMGASVEPVAMWTDDPARDIVNSAHEIGAGWILIGFHQPVFGANAMGGIVRTVLERSRLTPIHVGIVTRGEPSRVDRIFALVDSSSDGHAALDLASRVARSRQCNLHALLMPQEGGEPEQALKEIVKDASKICGRWLYTDVLRDRNPRQVMDQTPGQLVIVGKSIADDLSLPINVIPDEERCIVVVQGGTLDALPAPQSA
ncbi:MAG TPA: cation:proton antiporter [Candidatus Binataceae bacterium]|nr:cation:proton antiporter [Candidatus Binataceae bacterium]